MGYTPFKISESSAVSDSQTRYTYELKRPATEDDIIKKAVAIIARRDLKGDIFENPTEVGQFLVLQHALYEHEVFSAMFLSTRHQLIKFETLFSGTIDGCSVYPRVVVKRALELNASAVILAHNHPSGVAEPSLADRQITTRLKKALAIVDIRLLDHFVTGGREVVNFVTKGWL